MENNNLINEMVARGFSVEAATEIKKDLEEKGINLFKKMNDCFLNCINLTYVEYVKLEDLKFDLDIDDIEKINIPMHKLKNGYYLINDTCLD